MSYSSTSYAPDLQQKLARHDSRAEPTDLCSVASPSEPATIREQSTAVTVVPPIPRARKPRRHSYRPTSEGRLPPVSLAQRKGREEADSSDSASNSTQELAADELALHERIDKVNTVQARRYSRLKAAARTIATDGIMRHFHACDRMDVNPDLSAIREIIDDAIDGRRIFDDSSEPLPSSSLSVSSDLTDITVPEDDEASTERPLEDSFPDLTAAVEL